MDRDQLHKLLLEAQATSVGMVFQAMLANLDTLDAQALATGPDPVMGPGPFEGMSCLKLNEYVRVHVRLTQRAVASLRTEG